jgi:hypothetical protein
MAIRRKSKNGERGQVLILFAISLIVLLLFIGLTIDFGLAYVTKAQLGKAIDAAALAAGKNTGKGQAAFTPIATSAFFMNYGNTSRDAPGYPIVTVCGNSCNSGSVCGATIPCPTDYLGNTLLNISASTKIQPYFLGLLPAFNTVATASSAESKYARVEMSLVIDRSGSMSTNAPNQTLPAAVIGFVDLFDNVNDSVAMVSFSDYATVDVPFNEVAHPGVSGNFQTAITTSINSIDHGSPPLDGGYNGGTFSDGGILLANTEEKINLGLTGNIVHVVLFFTDGNANEIQNSLLCSGGSDQLKNAKSVLWNFGGYDSAPDVGFNVPANGNQQCDQNGRTICCSATFPAASQGGRQVAINWANVDQEAAYRVIADANAMRSATPPTIVYAVGLQGPGGSADKSTLCQIANDPSSACAPYFTYNPNTPKGEMVMAQDSTELFAAFQQIASDIRLRLLQ